MMLILISRLRWYLSGFSPAKLLLCSLWWMNILWEVALRLCKYPVNHQTFNLVINLLISVWTHGFLFYSIFCSLLSYLLNNLLVFVIIIYFSTKLSSWLLCPLVCSIILWKLPYFLAIVSGSFFPFFKKSVLHSAILLENSGGFSEKTAFRNQNLSARWVCYYWGVIVPCPLPGGLCLYFSLLITVGSHLYI